MTLSDDVSSTFTTAFTIPEGFKLPAALDAGTVVTEDFDRTFTISDVSVSGRTVTVTMSLNKDAIRNADSNEYTYLLLKDAVEKVGDTMKVTIPGIKVGEGIADGTRLTTMGAIEGAFAATASSPAGIEKDFSFKWTGEQTPDGKDAIAAADNNAIQLTFEMPSPVDVELPTVNDILLWLTENPLQHIVEMHSDVGGNASALVYITLPRRVVPVAA